MIPQWGTVIINHTEAITQILNNFPISSNMDYIYNKFINNFNSLCLGERIFFTAGTLDGNGLDQDKPMGSLIWENNRYTNKNSNSNNYLNNNTITNINKNMTSNNQINNDINLSNNSQLPFIRGINKKIYCIPNTYNYLEDISECNYKYLSVKHYDIKELQNSLTYYVNPFIRLIHTFLYWKEHNLNKSEIPDDVDNIKLFKSFISFCFNSNITNEHIELQTNHIKNIKVYSKIIRIENFEEDLNKTTNVLELEDDIKSEIYVYFNG